MDTLICAILAAMFVVAAPSADVPLVALAAGGALATVAVNLHRINAVNAII